MPEAITRERAFSTQRDLVEELIAYSMLHDIQCTVVTPDPRGNFRVRSFGCPHWAASAMMAIGAVVPQANEVFFDRLEHLTEPQTTAWQRFCRWLPWNRPIPRKRRPPS